VTQPKPVDLSDLSIAELEALCHLLDKGGPVSAAIIPTRH
jgi:hypothetical protein